jgi:NADP-dependent 3-hydroxy acid dehydrogenase YdfG
MIYKTAGIAIVTGGSGGIGKAIALKLADNGITVVVADIVALDKEYKNLIYRECDVTNGEAVDSLYGWTISNVGEPNILILNAGRGIHERLTEGDPEKWQNILHLNVMGVLRCIRAFVPLLEKNGKGDVIFISSVSANQPYSYGGVYSASKAAVNMIAETLRIETQPNVRVTIVNAGITDTGFFENQVSGHTNVDDIGMGSLGAEDVADDVFYAISKKNGTSINSITTRPSGQNF